MQRTFWDEIKLQFQTGPMYIRLLLLNVFVFLIVNIILLFMFLNKIPVDIGELKVLSVLAPTPDVENTVSHFWSIFLYMFLHIGFWHLLFNMLLLYFGGQMFSQFLSEKQLLNTYIFGGLSGLLFFMLAFNFFPAFENYRFSTLNGASASVMAILGAIAFYAPRMEIMLWGILRMRLIYLVLILAVLDFLAIPRDNPGGRIAHLGGLLFGLYASNVFRKPNHFLNKLDLTGIFFIRRWFKRKPKMKVKHRASNPRGKSDEEYNQEKKKRQERIDAILDKINKSGYESLTKEERDMLFNDGKDL